jgi:hypothetical protein
MNRDGLNLMESDVRSCFVFRFEAGAISLPAAAGKPRPFRDPAAVPIAQKIAEGLQREGYETTNVKPGKACHAGFECKFERMSVGVVFLIERMESGLECAVWSRPWRSLWRRRVPFTLVEIEEWRRLGAELDRIIKRNLKPDSYRWMTFREFEEQAS